MKILLAVTAASEAATGLALLAYPPIVIRLLFGVEITGVADVVSRFAGGALIGLGVAYCCGRLWRSTLSLPFFSSASAPGRENEWRRWHGCET
jgi:hypothetical protein